MEFKNAQVLGQFLALFKTFGGNPDVRCSDRFPELPHQISFWGMSGE